MIQQPELLDEKVSSIFMSKALQKDKSTQDEWRIQGIKLFKKKYYDVAVKCFLNQNYDDLGKRCLAYQEAGFGESGMVEADYKSRRSKVLKNLTKIENKKLLKRLIKKEQSPRGIYKVLEFSLKIKILKHIASCFFTGNDNNKAALIFELLAQYGKAAECHLEVNELKKATKPYDKAQIS